MLQWLAWDWAFSALQRVGEGEGERERERKQVGGALGGDTRLQREKRDGHSPPWEVFSLSTVRLHVGSHSISA